MNKYTVLARTIMTYKVEVEAETGDDARDKMIDLWEQWGTEKFAAIDEEDFEVREAIDQGEVVLEKQLVCEDCKSSDLTLEAEVQYQNGTLIVGNLIRAFCNICDDICNTEEIVPLKTWNVSWSEPHIRWGVRGETAEEAILIAQREGQSDTVEGRHNYCAWEAV
jgi:hypothetical protein